MLWSVGKSIVCKPEICFDIVLIIVYLHIMSEVKITYQDFPFQILPYESYFNFEELSHHTWSTEKQF